MKTDNYKKWRKVKKLKLWEKDQQEKAGSFQPELLASLEDFEFPFFCKLGVPVPVVSKKSTDAPSDKTKYYDVFSLLSLQNFRIPNSDCYSH